METDWEHPSLLYRITDTLGKNLIFGFIYSSYIKTLKLSGSENLLDFGSGSGAGSKHLAKLLSKHGGHLTCVDTSVYWTGVAKKRLQKYKTADFFFGEITKLKLPESSFDAVYIHFVLHHVPISQRDETVKEFNRILKPGGRIYIKEPQREYDGMPVSEIRRLMSDNNFKEVSGKEKKGTFSGIYIKQ